MRFFAIFLLGCSPAVVDTADSDPPASQSRINAVEWNCTEDDWRYQISTIGWADAVVVDVFLAANWDGGQNAGIWAETHNLPNVAFAEDGSWTRRDLELRAVDQTAQVADESTAFICDVHTPVEIASRVQLFEGSELADCVIWGQRSENYFNSALGGDCYCFDNADGCGEW